MNRFQILIVEDDPSIRKLISTTLKLHEYSYSVASKGKEAVMLSMSSKPDLILLDLGLPDIDGMEVIRSVRSWSQLPIIVISARGNDQDKISALDEGADDYLTKPFSTEELLARIRVVQRRLSYSTAIPECSTFVNGSLTIDLEAATVICDGKNIHLTATEYKLLKLLAMHVGKVLSYPLIIREIWGGGESDMISLRVHMATLRKKLGDPTSQEPLIQTHVGIGYSMNRY